MHLTRNQTYSQGYRGFESLPLRHKPFEIRKIEQIRNTAATHSGGLFIASGRGRGCWGWIYQFVLFPAPKARDRAQNKESVVQESLDDFQKLLPGHPVPRVFEALPASSAVPLEVSLVELVQACSTQFSGSAVKADDNHLPPPFPNSISLSFQTMWFPCRSCARDRPACRSENAA